MDIFVDWDLPSKFATIVILGVMLLQEFVGVVSLQCKRCKIYNVGYFMISLYLLVDRDQSRANIDFWTEYEYEYIRKVKFLIFVFEYPVFGDKYSNI